MQIIVISNAWGYKYGGINSFNFEFCCALRSYLINDAASNNGGIKLVIVSDISDQNKKEINVEGIVSCVSIKEDEFSADNLIGLLKEKIGIDKEETFFVGHDIITGQLAIDCAKAFNGKSLVFRHMAYEEYYSKLNPSEKAIDNKLEEQRKILLGADIVLGVGEKLTDSSKQIIVNNYGKALVAQILPGFDINKEYTHLVQSEQFRVFYSGRIEYENDKLNNNSIKQYDIVVKAFCELLNEEVIPADSKLFMCGITSPNAEEHLKELASNLTPNADIVFKTFTSHKKLMEILILSSVAVMPSFSEGFGLAATEALTANVPIIISKNSGLYKLIEHENLTNCIEAFEVSNKEDANVLSLKKCLLNIYKNQKQFCGWAKTLSEFLQKKYSWELVIEKLIKLLSVSKYYKINNKEFQKELIKLFFPQEG